MKAYSLLLCVLLAGCAQEPAIQPVQPLVVTPVSVSAPDLPMILPPPRVAIPKFHFQDPRLPTSIVGMDTDNYAAFRETLLLANKRELDWNSRLQRANKVIRLLNNPDDETPVPSNKPIILPIPKVRPTHAGGDTTG